MTLRKITEGMLGQQSADIVYENDVENQSAISSLAALQPDLSPSINLFNKKDVLPGKYLTSTGTGFMSATGAGRLLII